MPRAEAFRQLVAARAGGAFEYCRLLQIATGVTFHIEHVLPRSLGGKTVLRNLAHSCPGCNPSKSERTTGADHRGREQTLFSPRDYEPWILGWHLHFSLDRSLGIIVPRTAIGDATVRTLKMNDSIRVFARKLQIETGLIA